MNSKKWRFKEDILGHYINSNSSKTFQDAENQLNFLEERRKAGLNMPLLASLGDTVYVVEEDAIYPCIVEKISLSRHNGIWYELTAPEECPGISAFECEERDFNDWVFFDEEKAKEALSSVLNNSKMTQ